MNEFIKQDGKIIVNVPYAEAYIPESLFQDSSNKDPDSKTNVAVEYGEGIRTVALFNMRFYKSDEDDRDSAQLRTFKYPNTIDTFPTDQYVDILQLGKDAEPQKYRVLQYYRGDIMMDAQIPKSSLNCEKYLNLQISGKLPDGIGYQELLLSWMKNFRINGVNPKVANLTLQLMLSENARVRDNPMMQYRKLAGKQDKQDDKDFIICNMHEVASYSSVLAGLSFNNFSNKLLTGLNMSKEGNKQSKTPLEKVMSM